MIPNEVLVVQQSLSAPPRSVARLRGPRYVPPPRSSKRRPSWRGILVDLTDMAVPIREKVCGFVVLRQCMRQRTSSAFSQPHVKSHVKDVEHVRPGHESNKRMTHSETTRLLHGTGLWHETNERSVDVSGSITPSDQEQIVSLFAAPVADLITADGPSVQNPMTVRPCTSTKAHSRVGKLGLPYADSGLMN